jgi:hypothetical protein
MALKWTAQREMALAGEGGGEGDIEGRGTDPLTWRLLALDKWMNDQAPGKFY